MQIRTHMRTITHILVPVDFGASSLAALDFAVSIASKFGANMTLLHAAWLPALAYSGYAEDLSWPMDDMARAVKKELGALLEKTQLAWARTDSAIVLGDPWKVIVETAETSRADLIMMGTHGRHGMSRLFMGSVAERVVRASPIPVLTISDHAVDATRPRTPPQAGPSIC